MALTFYIASALALTAAAVALTRTHAVHGLLFLGVALVAAGVMLLALGAPLVAAFHVIVYAGAIVVLFLFAIMVAGLSRSAIAAERGQLIGRGSIVPLAIAAGLAALLLIGVRGVGGAVSGSPVEPARVGVLLFDEYLAGVQLAALLLFAGLLAAYHLARRVPPSSGESA